MAGSSLFIDTSGWASYLQESDPLHNEAVRLYRQAYTQGDAIYPTDHVLAELVALLSSSHYKLSRPRVIAIISTILQDPGIKIEPTPWPQFMEAWHLLEQRQDKGWSRVDAISIRAMERLGIIAALTTDRHFEQAGRIRLLK